MKTFTIRLDDKREKEFEEIKNDMGVKSDNEVIRMLIRDEYKRRLGNKKE